MNVNTQSAAGDISGDAQPSKSGDGPSRSTEDSERPSLFERLSSFFRYRNGSSLREEIADALAESDADEETFSPGERAMLNNILRLREVTVEDAMIPRADIKAVGVSTTLGELLSIFEESGHSRMPVYLDNLDDPRGMVHIRDVVGHITRQARQQPAAEAGADTRTGEGDASQAASLNLANVDLSKTIGELELMRPVLFVPPSMLASDLMGRMQNQRVQMALVIDEFGGTDGLVSLEDLVEMVVGDIEDEHDEDETLITEVGDGVWVVDGKAEIDEVAEKLGASFSPGEYGDGVDTIGGLLFNALGRVPERGEVVHAIPGYEFHVLDADPRRVKRVRIASVLPSETSEMQPAEHAG